MPDEDDEIGAIVLAGAGDRAFRSGGGNSSRAGGSENARGYGGRGLVGLPIEALRSTIRDNRKPDLAAHRFFQGDSQVADGRQDVAAAGRVTLHLAITGDLGALTHRDRHCQALVQCDSENIRAIGALGFESLAPYYNTEEAKEGTQALLEKRRPNFRAKHRK